MANTKTKSFWLKLFLALAGSILLITLIINPILKKLLTKQVEEKLVGNFYYGYKNMTVDLLKRSVTLEDVNWKFPKDTSVFNQGGIIRRFEINGISLLSLISNTDLHINEILFDSLDFLTRITSPSERDSTSKLKREGFDFYNLIKGQLNSLEIHTIKINSGNATWLNPENKKIWRRLYGVDLEVSDIVLDSATAASNNGWFTLSNVNLQSVSGELFLADSLHKIQTGRIKVDYKDQRIEIDSFKVVPLFTRAQMSKVKKYETDRLEVVVPHIDVRGFDVERIMTRKELRIQSIYLEGLSLIAFRDKNSPFSPYQFPPLPQIALKNSKVNMTIDSVKLRNGYIKYEQLSETTHKRGEVFFTKLNADFFNITNDSIGYLQNPRAKLKANALLMGASKLDVNFEFNLINKNGDHWFKGSLGQFDLTVLNKVFEPLAAVSIRSGVVNKMNFDVRLNNDVSDGKVTFLYTNLKIDKLNKDDLKSKDFDNSLASLIANTFLIKKSNPSGKSDPRIGIVHFNRVKEKSIFNFWWKSLLEGMKSTVLSTEESK